MAGASTNVSRRSSNKAALGTGVKPSLGVALRRQVPSPPVPAQFQSQSLDEPTLGRSASDKSVAQGRTSLKAPVSRSSLSQKSDSGVPAQSKVKSSRLSGSRSETCKVVVRGRPLSGQELAQGNRAVWHCTATSVEELLNDGVTPANRLFNYSQVFGPDASNETVYEMACKPIVQGALAGYNGTIFAYGQTSSGKTYTLMGDVNTNPGVAPQAITDVFKLVAESKEQWEVHISYMEIYNETITDLLQEQRAKATNLKIAEDTKVGPHARDLTETRVETLRDCLDVLACGEKRRTYASTEMNVRSSRSHTLVRLRIHSKAASDTHSDTVIVDNMRNVASDFSATQCRIGAERASLYLVDGLHEELYIQHGDITLRIPISAGIAGSVAISGECVNIPDAYEDPRFNADIDKQTGFKTRAILCVPVKANGQVVGVLQFFNKINSQVFDGADELLVKDVAARMGPLIVQAEGHCKPSITSFLNIVDLAGSERQTKSGSVGVRLQEAGHINTSLMTLGKCISALSEGRREHVPFRDSKLTHLLSSSLGGNANTCIICAFSPASQNRSETLTTLFFGQRAQNVVNHVKQNVHVDPTELVKVYELEIVRLRQALAKVTESSVETPSFRPPTVDNVLRATLQDIEATVQETHLVFKKLLPPGVSIRLHALVAVNPTGEGAPKPVVQVSARLPEEPSICASLFSKLPHWISVEVLQRWSERLRGWHEGGGVCDDECLTHLFGELSALCARQPHEASVGIRSPLRRKSEDAVPPPSNEHASLASSAHCTKPQRSVANFHSRRPGEPIVVRALVKRDSDAASGVSSSCSALPRRAAPTWVDDLVFNRSPASTYESRESTPRVMAADTGDAFNEAQELDTRSNRQSQPVSPVLRVRNSWPSGYVSPSPSMKIYVYPPVALSMRPAVGSTALPPTPNSPLRPMGYESMPRRNPALIISDASSFEPYSSHSYSLSRRISAPVL